MPDSLLTSILRTVTSVGPSDALMNRSCAYPACCSGILRAADLRSLRAHVGLLPRRISGRQTHSIRRQIAREQSEDERQPSAGSDPGACSALHRELAQHLREHHARRSSLCNEGQRNAQRTTSSIRIDELHGAAHLPDCGQTQDPAEPSQIPGS